MNHINPTPKSNPITLTLYYIIVLLVFHVYIILPNEDIAWNCYIYKDTTADEISVSTVDQSIGHIDSNEQRLV